VEMAAIGSQGRLKGVGNLNQRVGEEDA
ncbi:hypothetical protein Tco_1390275, partial [Tanacetum coccineum]